MGKLQSQSVVDAYNRSIKQFPSQKVICGFSRRFDASYRDAHRRVVNGGIGRPSVFRSQTCDKLDPSGFFVAYAEFSGGIFVDCSIHDIDLALWFFGEDSKVKSVSAVGITAVQPDLRKHNDRDNAAALVEFYVSFVPFPNLTLLLASQRLSSVFNIMLTTVFPLHLNRTARSHSSSALA